MSDVPSRFAGFARHSAGILHLGGSRALGTGRALDFYHRLPHFRIVDVLSLRECVTFSFMHSLLVKFMSV